MARANRLSGQGGIFHVTHRCHNRQFLLKFALDRDGYRAKLREHLPQFDVSVLDDGITSNACARRDRVGSAGPRDLGPTGGFPSLQREIDLAKRA